VHSQSYSVTAAAPPRGLAESELPSRAKRNLFAGEHDPVRDVVLEQWGTTLISNHDETPEEGLIALLDKLQKDVEGPPATAGDDYNLK
jgi:hypothetical protein